MTNKREKIVYPEGMIQLMRCSNTKLSFAVRFDLAAPGRWSAAWAFKINDAQEQEFTKRASHNSRTIRGKLTNDLDSYQGCLFCGARKFFQCASCGYLGCRDQQTTLSCPWCKEELSSTGRGITQSTGQSDL